MALEGLGIAANVFAVVDMSAKVIGWCAQYAQDVSHAKEDKKRLSEEVTRLNLASVNVRELLRGPHGSRLKASQALFLATVHGQSQLRHIETRLAGQRGQNTTSFKALKWPFQSKDLQLILQDLQRCTKAIYSALEADQTSIILDIDHRTALDRLPEADGASFDSHAEEHNPICLPNTRVELLKDVCSWIDDPHSKTIFWLNGMAGTGKSTISRTVARSRSKQGDLGASFFFKRGETDRGNLAKFVPTLARQLAWSIPGVASAIKKAIDADPAIVGKAVREQFDKLIRDPLSKAVETSASPPSLVIVIDALDECEGDADIKLLLELFSNARSTGSLRVRVLVTSRPELPSIIEHDILVFLRHEFANIRRNFNSLAEEELKLPMHWPGETDLEKLTMAAAPLFIFAATLCRFINDSRLGSPDELLQRVLHLTGNSHASKLDMTYSPVLEQQVVNRSGGERRDVIESFRLVVGTIVTLASPLSMRALALLLDVHIDKVSTRLKVLHSVLDVPKTLNSPVRLLHLSFRDYLIDPENRETLEFWVDEKLAHRNLTKQCLRLMRGTLRENICGLSFPGMRRSAVDDVQLEKCIPPQLQYACLYWVHHQTKADFEPNDSREVYDFLTTHFLHWLEVLSLMNRAREGLDSLRSLVDWLGNRGDLSLSNFLADAVRFLQANFSVIDEAPLQIYSSALVFAPKRSLIRKSFEDGVPGWLAIWPQLPGQLGGVLARLDDGGIGLLRQDGTDLERKDGEVRTSAGGP
ncbi:hypothetical protein MRS44_003779 [Fusarium solani]|uniref:uncharacterized protein n=1 Tax=Fusarium solani TaxID=169388 RepID=UPI0032C41251|nr:hypothetical protein MRS44_003779 [Fusarium solani]